MRFRSYLKTAAAILEDFPCDTPFNNYLKAFFRSNRKFGSGDRKWISELCYRYFRLGKSWQKFPIDERLLSAWFLGVNGPDPLLENLKPEWIPNSSWPVEEKWNRLNPGESMNAILPGGMVWSEGLQIMDFARSHLVQPNLFARIRPGMNSIVLERLKLNAIPYSVLNMDCLVFENGTKLDVLFQPDRELVIQDYSSQRITEFFPVPDPAKGPLAVYDCCAGSGGKSILAYDSLMPIKLTVSDIRESILINLKKRFEAAGIKRYHDFVIDLAQPDGNYRRKIKGARKGRDPEALNVFDLVIADVPCTGSGTWGRNPDALYCFNPEKLKDFQEKQKRIVDRVVPMVKPGGFFLYITCSVFRQENEEMVSYLESHHHLRISRMGLLGGFALRADTLFAALFTLPG